MLYKKSPECSENDSVHSGGFFVDELENLDFQNRVIKHIEHIRNLMFQSKA